MRLGGRSLSTSPLPPALVYRHVANSSLGLAEFLDVVVESRYRGRLGT
jgi:hypothetical protein